MLSDFRFAFRSLARSPKFSLTIVVTLALAIGFNTAMFSFFQRVLLRPLPYGEVERIVVVSNSPDNLSEAGGSANGLFAEDFLDLRGRVSSFESLSTYTSDVATALYGGRPELIYGAVVSEEFFSTMGSEPLLGAVFETDKVSEDQSRRVVLSYGYWQANFAGETSVIGETLVLNRVPFVIGGVMPPDFDFPHEAHFWASPANEAPESQIGQTASNANGRGNSVRSFIGRLAPGVSLSAAEQELAGQISRLPNPNNVQKSRSLVSLSEMSLGKARPVLYTLLGSVGLVLLIACMNVANLMLARGTTRQREMSIRLAVGSTRIQIARQLIAESLLLSLAAGILGSLLGYQLFLLLREMAAVEIPKLIDAEYDVSVLVFGLCITLATGLGCGLAPALGTGGADLKSALKSGGRGVSRGGFARRLRLCLVGGEVMVSVALLIAAVLLLRSFDRLQEVYWGFDPQNVATARVVFVDEKYSSEAERIGFYRTFLGKLKQRTGFEEVGTCLDRIGESWIRMPFVPEGHAYATMGEAPQASYHMVSEDYLRTMRIPILEGRGFTTHDNELASKVVVIDETLARQYFPGESAVGKRIQLSWFGGGEWAEVIGVTARVKSDGPNSVVEPELYLVFPQAPWNNFFVHVRTPLEMAVVENEIREVLAEIDGGVPLSMVATMEEIVDEPALAKRFQLLLTGGFALMALLLASLGIYAVIDYEVAQRLRELGIRLALGGRPESLVRLVMVQGMGPVGVGLGFGVILACGVGYLMRPLLFGISPFDFVTYVSVSGILLAIGVVACRLSARGAVAADPLVALQAD